MDNGAKLPICVDFERVVLLDKWLAKNGKQPTMDGKKCGRCIDMTQMNRQLAKERGKELDHDYTQYIQSTDDSSIPSSSSGPPLIPRHHKVESPPSEPQQPGMEDVRQSWTSGYLSWVGHIFQKFKSGRPFVMSWDMWKSCLWDLFTHAGFLTYPHHDAAGFCTYVFVREGCKMWGIHRLKVSPIHDTRRKVYDLMRNVLRPHGNLGYMFHTDLYTFFLMRGDVL